MRLRREDCWTCRRHSPFSRENKKLIAANVYAHVWQQAVSNSFAVGCDGPGRVCSLAARAFAMRLARTRPSIYRHFAIVSESDLREAVLERLGPVVAAGS